MTHTLITKDEVADLAGLKTKSKQIDQLRNMRPPFWVNRAQGLSGFRLACGQVVLSRVGRNVGSRRKKSPVIWAFYCFWRRDIQLPATARPQALYIAREVGRWAESFQQPSRARKAVGKPI